MNDIPDPLLVVARRLGKLCDDVVFVGGMIRSLLITDPAANGARPTDDVDLIVETPNRVAYLALCTQLREAGFREANEEGAPVCRWITDGVRVDVMPIDPQILGFTNVSADPPLRAAAARPSSIAVRASMNRPSMARPCARAVVKTV